MSARQHPYDLVFGAGDFESTVFPEIREEAETRGIDMWDRSALLQLVRVGELLRSLLPPDAHGTAFGQFGAIVAHAFWYWLTDKQTLEIDEVVLRQLLDGPTAIGSWDMVPPAPAGYMQLPRNLIFTRIEEGAPAEAVDGFFWAMPGENDVAVPPFRRLEAVLVLGLTRNREGFSIIEVATDVTEDESGHFGDATAREHGKDFENVLPGGEGKLFALTNRLEVLKLISRVFWTLANSQGR